MKFPPFETKEPVECGAKKCPALAFCVSGDSRPFVIECGKCKDFVRGGTEAEAEAFWRWRKKARAA